MNNKLILGVLAIVLLAGGGYFAYANQPDDSVSAVTNQMGSTNSGENPEPGSAVHDLPVEPAAAAARKDLAARLGVNEKRIVIMLVEEKTWSDGCLGLGGPAESCLAALVDGFRVEMETAGKTYIYRTDKTGAAVRAETEIE